MRRSSFPARSTCRFSSLDHAAAQRAITFGSASKGWNIPGLKCGVAIAGSAELAGQLAERWEALLAGQLGVLASVAAFADSLPWLDAVLAQLDENRGYLSTLLSEQLPAVRYVPPEASFLAWLDCRQLGLGDDPAADFLARGQVALSPGPHFGSSRDRPCPAEHGHLAGPDAGGGPPDGRRRGGGIALTCPRHGTAPAPTCPRHGTAPAPPAARPSSRGSRPGFPPRFPPLVPAPRSPRPVRVPVRPPARNPMNVTSKGT